MTSQTSIVTGVDFVCVAASDPAAAMDFYGHVLGLPDSRTAAPSVDYTPHGYVSGSSPRSHSLERSSGSTARVSSRWMTASNCVAIRALR